MSVDPFEAIILVIIVLFIFYMVFTIPELIIEDFKDGIMLIKNLRILEGIGILTRPFWGTILIILLFYLFMRV